jgi:hypothetical protein
MKKQTVVKWLQEQLNPDMKTMQGVIVQDLLEQAKEIYHDQILEAYREGRTDQQSTIDKWYDRTSAEYYNQTYK